MANTTTKATLGGFPLLASSKVEWKLVDGVRPNMEVFSLIPAHADALLRNNDKPVSLVIEPRKTAKVQIDFLYVLREAPGENPNVKKVLVADRRWMWDSEYIERDYNIRRNVGYLRATSVAGQEIKQVQLHVTTPNTRYWAWSLHEPVNGAAGCWLPSESVEDVLQEVLSREKKDFSITVPYLVFPKGKGSIDRTPWEGISLRDGGAVALGRLFSQLPAVTIKVEPSGLVVVYLKSATENGNDPATPKSLAALGVPIDGFGSIAKVNNRLMRPRKIVVKYLKEIETMFESVTEQSRNQTVAEPGDNTRYMVNVGQVTEPFLSNKNQDNVEGTWMPFDSIKGALGLIDQWPDRAGFRVTQEFIRRALLPKGVSLWASLLLASIKNPDVLWSNRVSMLQRCYRRTYQINERWMSRIRSMRAYRVSVVNQATGTLAPAAVYSDYAILPSDRGMMCMTEQSSGWVPAPPGEQYIYRNVPGYVDQQPSPAHLKIIDEDNGIVLIDYETDPMGMTQSIIPSLVDNNPNGDISNVAYGACTADGLPEGGTDFPALAPGHRVKVIFTCIPASPNNDQKLYSVTVLPGQAEAALGYSLGECVGPEMEIFVGPNVVTAKIRWDDARAVDIERSFGVTPGIPNLTGLILNDGPSTPGTGASLSTVALAHACTVYGSLVDRVEGAQAGIMNQGVSLDGWAASVAHSLSTQGHLRTILSYPGQIPKMNISGFLDANTRNALYKFAQPSAVV